MNLSQDGNDDAQDQRSELLRPPKAVIPPWDPLPAQTGDQPVEGVDKTPALWPLQMTEAACPGQEKNSVYERVWF